MSGHQQLPIDHNDLLEFHRWSDESDQVYLINADALTDSNISSSPVLNDVTASMMSTGLTHQPFATSGVEYQQLVSSASETSFSSVPQAMGHPIISFQNMPPHSWLIPTNDVFNSFSSSSTETSSSSFSPTLSTSTVSYQTCPIMTNQVDLENTDSPSQQLSASSATLSTENATFNSAAQLAGSSSPSPPRLRSARKNSKSSRSKREKSNSSSPSTSTANPLSPESSAIKNSAKAEELSQMLSKEVDPGSEDFQLTSAIRYDPGLYYQDYIHKYQKPLHRKSSAATKASEKTLLIEAQEKLAKEITQDKTVPDVCFFLLPLHQKRLQFAADYFNWDFELTPEVLKAELQRAILNMSGITSDESVDGKSGDEEKDQNESKGDWARPHKIRALINKSGTLKIEVSPASPRPNLFSGFKKIQDASPSDPVYDVVLNTSSILISPFTSFKTTKRDVYNKARRECLRPPLGESSDEGPAITSSSAAAAKNPSKVYPSDSPQYQEVLMYNTRGEVTEGSITNVAFFRDGGWKTPPLGTGCLCGVVRHHLLTKQMVQEDVITKRSLVDGEPVLLFNGVQGVIRGVLRLEK